MEELARLVRDCDFPLDWVAQKPRLGSPGPLSAGVYIGDGDCQWPHGQPADWDGLLWLHCCFWGFVGPMDPFPNLAVPLFFRGWVIAWLERCDPLSDCVPGFRPPNSLFMGRPRPLSNTVLLRTMQLSLQNSISFHPVALAGCTSVTDDMHTSLCTY